MACFDSHSFRQVGPLFILGKCNLCVLFSYCYLCKQWSFRSSVMHGDSESVKFLSSHVEIPNMTYCYAKVLVLKYCLTANWLLYLLSSDLICAFIG